MKGVKNLDQGIPASCESVLFLGFLYNDDDNSIGLDNSLQESRVSPIFNCKIRVCRGRNKTWKAVRTVWPVFIWLQSTGYSSKQPKIGIKWCKQQKVTLIPAHNWGICRVCKFKWDRQHLFTRISINKRKYSSGTDIKYWIFLYFFKAFLLILREGL